MRFVDANVFIYALLKPRRKLRVDEQNIKVSAKAIFERINDGEEVLLSTVHLSEIVNVLEDSVGNNFSINFMKDVMSKINITIESVSKDQYLLSTLIAEDKNVSINDALAYVLMRENDISEIYSFDKHFDNLPVNRITK